MASSQFSVARISDTTQSVLADLQTGIATASLALTGMAALLTGDPALWPVGMHGSVIAFSMLASVWSGAAFYFAHYPAGELKGYYASAY